MTANMNNFAICENMVEMDFVIDILVHIILSLHSIDKNTTKNRQVICWQLLFFI